MAARFSSLATTALLDQYFTEPARDIRDDINRTVSRPMDVEREERLAKRNDFAQQVATKVNDFALLPNVCRVAISVESAENSQPTPAVGATEPTGIQPTEGGGSTSVTDGATAEGPNASAQSAEASGSKMTQPSVEPEAQADAEVEVQAKPGNQAQVEAGTEAGDPAEPEIEQEAQADTAYDAPDGAVDPGEPAPKTGEQLEEEQFTANIQPQDRFNGATPLRPVMLEDGGPQQPVPCLGSVVWDHRPRDKDAENQKGAGKQKHGVPAAAARTDTHFKNAKERHNWFEKHDRLEGDKAKFKGVQKNTVHTTVKLNVHHGPGSDPLERLEFLVTTNWHADGRKMSKTSAVGVTSDNIETFTRSQNLESWKDLAGKYIGANGDQLPETGPNQATEFCITLKPGSIYSRNVMTVDEANPLKDHFRLLANHLRRGCKIFFVIQETGAADHVGSALTALASRRPEPYTRAWFKRDRRSNVEQIDGSRILDLGDRPTRAIPPRINFAHEQEYVAIETYAVQQEYEYTELCKTSKMCGLTARVLSVPGAEGRCLVVLLQRNGRLNEDTLELEPGDKVAVRIHALNPQDMDEQMWSGEVSGPIPFTRVTDAPLIVNRPFDKESQEHLGLDPDTLRGIVDTSALVDQDQATKVIDESQTYLVDVQLQVNVEQIRRRLLTISNLQGLMKWETRGTGGSVTRTLLLSNRFDTLPTIDMLHGVPTTVREWLMDMLTDDQKLVVGSMDKQPAGLALMVGPAGSGKTYAALRIGVAHLHSTTVAEPRLLLTSPLNSNVDGLAEQIDGLIRSRGNSYVGGIVVRLQSLGTEKAIFNHVAQEMSQVVGASGARPAIIDEGLRQQQRDNAASAALSMDDALRKTARRHVVGDHRVNEGNFKYSLGYQTLVAAGIKDAEDGAPSLRELANETMGGFSDLHRLYFTSVGGDFGQEERKKLQELQLIAMRWVLNQARVVCCTMDRASNTSVYVPFKPTMIIADEAARALAAESRAVFANFPSCHRRIMLGDPRQSQPQTRAPATFNNFAMQLGLPEFTRLLLAGFPAHSLLTQKRFSGTINKLISTVFYNGELRSVLPEGQDGDVTAKVEDAIAKLCGKKAGNVTLVRMDCADLHVDGVTGTVVNKDSAYASWWMLGKFLDEYGLSPDRLAILTPYRGQLRLHESIRTFLIQRSRPYAAVTLETWDKMQSLQCDVVIADVTAANKIGFLRESHRINTGLSRARFGLFLVADVDRLRTDKLFGGRALQKAVDLLKETGNDVYFNPDVRTLIRKGFEDHKFETAQRDVVEGSAVHDKFDGGAAFAGDDLLPAPGDRKNDGNEQGVSSTEVPIESEPAPASDDPEHQPIAWGDVEIAMDDIWEKAPTSTEESAFANGESGAGTDDEEEVSVGTDDEGEGTAGTDDEGEGTAGTDNEEDGTIGTDFEEEEEASDVESFHYS